MTAVAPTVPESASCSHSLFTATQGYISQAVQKPSCYRVHLIGRVLLLGTALGSLVEGICRVAIVCLCAVGHCLHLVSTEHFRIQKERCTDAFALFSTCFRGLFSPTSILPATKKAPLIELKPAPLSIEQLDWRLKRGDIALRIENELDYAKKQMDAESDKCFILQKATQEAIQKLRRREHWKNEQIDVGGYQVGIAHYIGQRFSMEDTHLATSFNIEVGGKSYSITLFGIFDGHGGSSASKFVSEQYPAVLSEMLQKFSEGKLLDQEKIWNALKWTTATLNARLDPDIAQEQGTTATVAMILDETLWVSNVGDSRTIVDNQGEPNQLSEDAKPDDPRYKKGIERRGGSVRPAIFSYPFVDPARVGGRLAVGRAIGDQCLRYAINPRCKITATPLSQIKPGSQLFLACDGIFDVTSTRQVVQTLHQNSNTPVGQLAADVVYSAFAAGSLDNLSAMVIRFPK